MIRISSLILGFALAFQFSVVAHALQRGPISSQEYIQSVSPLAGGGSVISRSTPGQNVQAVTTIAQLPTVPTQTPQVGYQPRVAYSGQWNGNPNQVASGGYVYPSSTPGGVLAQQPTNTLGLQPLGSRAFQQTRFFQSAPNNQYAQNCPTCVGGTTTNYPVQTYSPIQTPTGSSVYTPPAALTAPTLTAPQPIQVPQGGWNTNPGMQYNLDPAWNANFASSPSRTNYTPIFALRNLPPGTYLGQGSLGQPKAYIDGEPIRNLLRYLSY